jgi:tetratricopeptide (TPR) repeat protein
MKMRKIVLLAALVPLAALAPPAAADDKQDCAGNIDDRKIKACTALIDGGRETKASLAMDYRNRGIARARQKDYDLAIADYSSAIELDPRFTAAYNDRALAYTNKGDFQHAVADVNKAVELGQKAEPALATTAAMSTPAKVTANKIPSSPVQGSSIAGGQQPSQNSMPARQRVRPKATTPRVPTGYEVAGCTRYQLVEGRVREICPHSHDSVDLHDGTGIFEGKGGGGDGAGG